MSWQIEFFHPDNMTIIPPPPENPVGNHGLEPTDSFWYHPVAKRFIYAVTPTFREGDTLTPTEVADVAAKMRQAINEHAVLEAAEGDYPTVNGIHLSGQDGASCHTCCRIFEYAARHGLACH